VRRRVVAHAQCNAEQLCRKQLHAQRGRKRAHGFGNSLHHARSGQAPQTATGGRHRLAAAERIERKAGVLLQRLDARVHALRSHDSDARAGGERALSISRAALAQQVQRLQARLRPSSVAHAVAQRLQNGLHRARVARAR
jgi:hypothetical protein